MRVYLVNMWAPFSLKIRDLHLRAFNIMKIREVNIFMSRTVQLLSADAVNTYCIFSTCRTTVHCITTKLVRDFAVLLIIRHQLQLHKLLTIAHCFSRLPYLSASFSLHIRVSLVYIMVSFHTAATNS
jgi:hypothetical protein